MKPTNKSFIYHTLAALFYNGLAAISILLNQPKAYYFMAGLFLTAGFHLIYMFISTLLKIRKLQPVGNLGYSILSVFFIHIIFWLLFVNLP